MVKETKGVQTFLRYHFKILAQWQFTYCHSTTHLSLAEQASRRKHSPIPNFLRYEIHLLSLTPIKVSQGGRVDFVRETLNPFTATTPSSFLDLNGNPCNAKHWCMNEVWMLVALLPMLSFHGQGLCASQDYLCPGKDTVPVFKILVKKNVLLQWTIFFYHVCNEGMFAFNQDSSKPPLLCILSLLVP